MERIRSSCRLCFNGCGVLVSLDAGRPVAVEGDPEHPVSRGRLCPRGKAALEVLNHPDRLRRPLVRDGERGAGRWRTVDWDEALDTVISGLKDTADRLGAQAVAFMRGGSKGTSDDHLTRLANIFGSPNVSTTSSICYSATSLASVRTYGFMAYPDMAGGPRCIVLWGFNPRATHHPMHREIRDAVAAGARLVVIDPLAGQGDGDLVLRPRPGSDGLLALAMIHCVLDEGLHDAAFTSRWTVGFERLREHVLPYSPEAVAEATWLDPEAIRAAARLYADARPGCILWGNGLEDGSDNFQTCRAICALRALAGNVGAPGADVMWSSDAELRRRDPALTRPDLLPEDMAAKRLGAVAGLLPGFGYAPHNLVARAILEGEPYPVRAAYLQGGNLLCTDADTRYMADALKKLDFFAATDQFMTPTTALADVVLPATMYLEEDSVEQPWQWPFASAVVRAADPGLARSEGRIANDLARRLRGGEYAFAGMDEFLDFYLEPTGMDFETFLAQGTIVARPLPLAHEDDGFPTPSGKVEIYSDALAEAGFAPLPSPRGPEPLGEDLPLVLSSRKSAVFYHSCGRQLPSLRRARPEPLARLHPDTARCLGIGEGDMARIATARGAVRMRVRLDAGQDPRIVAAEHGWWFPEKGHAGDFGAFEANLNLLTDAAGPLGRELGSTTLRGFACRVELDPGPGRDGSES